MAEINKPSVTTCNELPDELQNYFLCLLLHTREKVWDGTYRYDELLDKDIPNVKMVCRICDEFHNKAS